MFPITTCKHGAPLLCQIQNWPGDSQLYSRPVMLLMLTWGWHHSQPIQPYLVLYLIKLLMFHPLASGLRLVKYRRGMALERSICNVLWSSCLNYSFILSFAGLKMLRWQQRVHIFFSLKKHAHQSFYWFFFLNQTILFCLNTLSRYPST